MIRKKKICVSCQTEQYIFSRGRCQNCASREDNKPLKGGNIRKISAKGLENKKEKAILTDLQFELFKEIYKESLIKRCYECNCYVDGKSSGHFHHLLYKSQFPQFRLEKWNIVILCLNCHSQTHLDIKKTPKVEKLTEIIKEKYN